MNGLKKLLTATFLSAAMLFTGGAAQAMPFQQFDHMANQDRQDYMDFLMDSAQKVLTAQGRDADAAKVYHLFHDISPGSSLSLGEAEFEMNLAKARVIDSKRAIRDPNLPRIQVESALTVTLKKNGIELTPEFYRGLVQLASTFKPQFPPLQQPEKEKKE